MKDKCSEYGIKETIDTVQKASKITCVKYDYDYIACSIGIGSYGYSLYEDRIYKYI